MQSQIHHISFDEKINININIAKLQKLYMSESLKNKHIKYLSRNIDNIKQLYKSIMFKSANNIVRNVYNNYLDNYMVSFVIFSALFINFSRQFAFKKINDMIYNIVSYFKKYNKYKALVNLIAEEVFDNYFSYMFFNVPNLHNNLFDLYKISQKLQKVNLCCICFINNIPGVDVNIITKCFEDQVKIINNLMYIFEQKQYSNRARQNILNIIKNIQNVARNVKKANKCNNTNLHLIKEMVFQFSALEELCHSLMMSSGNISDLDLLSDDILKKNKYNNIKTTSEIIAQTDVKKNNNNNENFLNRIINFFNKAVDLFFSCLCACLCSKKEKKITAKKKNINYNDNTIVNNGSIVNIDSLSQLARNIEPQK